MRIKIISGSLSEIDKTLNDYECEHYIDNDGFFVTDEVGVECLEKILGIKYEIIEGKSITPKDIYFMTER